MNDSLDQSYGVSMEFSTQLFPVYCLTLNDGRTTSNLINKNTHISLLDVNGVITNKKVWKEGMELVGSK